VGTNDVYGKPLDVDSLSLRISYPDGVTFKQVETLQFRHTKTGVYETDFTFLQGGAYAFHAVATKELYNSGANSPDPITVVSGAGPGRPAMSASSATPTALTTRTARARRPPSRCG